jgi:hypothetical protein
MGSDAIGACCYGHDAITFESPLFLQDGKVIDSVWYIKEKHDPGLYTCHLGMDTNYERMKLRSVEKTKAAFFKERLADVNKRLKINEK